MTDPTPEEREDARVWMLEVCCCDEKLGDDGMCDCARLHFEAIRAAVEAAIKKNNYAWELEVVKAEGDRQEWCAKAVEYLCAAWSPVKAANVAAAIRRGPGDGSGTEGGGDG